MRRRQEKPAPPPQPIQLYKVLTADGHSPYITAYAWSLPTRGADGSWVPGAWHEEPASVFDIGHGLHVTPEPDRYRPNATCVAYACEAEGYREDITTDGHVVALRVRLLRPVSDEESAAAARAWRAQEQVSYAKARNAERLKRACDVSKRARESQAALREAGVESPALLAFKTLAELTPTASWRDLNSCYQDALSYANVYLDFDPEDIRLIYAEYDGHHWFGRGSGTDEHRYAKAIEAGNKSACVAWEHFFKRKPWWLRGPEGGRSRLHVGSHFDWQGLRVKVTSFDGADALVACAYETVRTLRDEGDERRARYEEKLVRRFKITRAEFTASAGAGMQPSRRERTPHNSLDRDAAECGSV